MCELVYTELGIEFHMCDFKYTELGRKFRLSAQGALLGTITPNIRQIFIGLVEKTVQFVVIFDGEISEDDEDNMSCVGTEIMSDFSEFGDGKLLYNEQFLSIPYPEQYVVPENHFCVYARKEQA